MITNAIIFTAIGVCIIFIEPKATPFLIAASILYGFFLLVTGKSKPKLSDKQKTILNSKAVIEEHPEWITTKKTLLEGGFATPDSIDDLEWEIVAKTHEDWIAFEEKVERKATIEELEVIIGDAIMLVGIGEISPDIKIKFGKNT